MWKTILTNWKIKKNMIISIDAEKAFDKIQHPYWKRSKAHTVWRWHDTVHQFSSLQSLSHVWLFATPLTAAFQASLSITNSQSLPKHVHWVGDAIQPSQFCCPLLLLPSIFPHQGLFKWVSSSHQVAKVLEFQLQHQSFQWTPRTDFP